MFQNIPEQGSVAEEWTYRPSTIVCTQVCIKSTRILFQVGNHIAINPGVTGVQEYIQSVTEDSPCDCGDQR